MCTEIGHIVVAFLISFRDFPAKCSQMAFLFGLSTTMTRPSLSTLCLQEDIVFYEDYPAISGDAPNWQAYLVKRPYLLWLRNHSTHWRATCRYNTDGIVYTDYLRASLKDFDIIRDVPTVIHVCRPYEYVNIRGNECVNCTARTWYKKGDYPLHIDSHYQYDCDFDGSRTDTAVYGEDNFGLYYNSSINPKFRCTSSENDTTQIWIGGK